MDIIDSTTRTYALINNNGTFEWYENFVDVNEDKILWPIEIDNDFHYDFIGSNVNCSSDSCTTNFFQVLDPLNQDLLNQFLSKTDKYEGLYKAGVIDPAKVVRVALENAASVAGMLLTTECVISDIPEENPAPMPPMGGGGMPGMM